MKELHKHHICLSLCGLEQEGGPYGADEEGEGQGRQRSPWHRTRGRDSALYLSASLKFLPRTCKVWVCLCTSTFIHIFMSKEKRFRREGREYPSLDLGAGEGAGKCHHLPPSGRSELPNPECKGSSRRAKRGPLGGSSLQNNCSPPKIKYDPKKRYKHQFNTEPGGF